MIDDVKLEDFANNSFTQGYLKTWKAMGICRTVDSMKDVNACKHMSVTVLKWKAFVAKTVT
jgi:hypothetical protein